jgi:hypothetical protein
MRRQTFRRFADFLIGVGSGIIDFGARYARMARRAGCRRRVSAARRQPAQRAI